MTRAGARDPRISPHRHVFGAAFYTGVETIVRPNLELPIVGPNADSPIVARNLDLPINRRNLDLPIVEPNSDLPVIRPPSPPPPFREAISTSRQDGASSVKSSTPGDRADPTYMRNLRRITIPPIFHTRSADMFIMKDPRRDRQLERERAQFRKQWITGNAAGPSSAPNADESREPTRADNRRSTAADNTPFAEMQFSGDNENTTADAGPGITRRSSASHDDTTRTHEIAPNIDPQNVESCVDDIRSQVKKEIEECEESFPQEAIQNESEVESAKLPIENGKNETREESNRVESTCEKPDISTASVAAIPELLAEDVGNRIPACIAEKPRREINLHLNSHGRTKRPRIVEEIICIEGTMFEKSSFSNASSPAKKLKSGEVTAEEKSREEDDEEEEEEIVSIMANASKGKRENTSIETRKKCRLRKQFRELFGKSVTLSEIEEEDRLLSESIPKKRRKESRMSLDSGVSLSEVISEQVTVSPDEFHEKIAEEMAELPAEVGQLDGAKSSGKIGDLDPLVRSMPLLDSSYEENIDSAFPEVPPDVGANFPEKPEINVEGFGGKLKILITPFHSTGADSFPPMTLEFDLTNGSHSSTTNCTTEFVPEANSTGAENRQDNRDDLSEFLAIGPPKNCQITREKNSVSILGVNVAPVTTNILVSTEMDVEINSQTADAAAISAENLVNASQEKCQVETNGGDDLAIMDFNQKPESPAADTIVGDKIAYPEEAEEKSISSATETCLKDKIIDSKDLHQKSVSPDTKNTSFDDKIVDSEIPHEKSISAATEAIGSEDFHQRNIFSGAEISSNENTLSPTHSSEKNEDDSHSTLSKRIICDPERISLTSDDINGQISSQSFNSASQIETIVIKEEMPEGFAINEELPEAAELAFENQLTAITAGQEQQIKDENTAQIQEQQINDENTAQIQEQQINDENTAQIQEQQIKDENTAQIQEQQINDENTAQIQEQQINDENTEQIQEQQINDENTAQIQEQQINDENTAQIQEQQINDENTAQIQEQLIGVENSATNSKDKQSSSNSMPKLRLLHHRELGSRWCPTPINGSVYSTDETSKSAPIQRPIAPNKIQPSPQGKNSAELLYPDNQLQYSPYFVANAAPVVMNIAPNLCDNSARNNYNVPENQSANFSTSCSLSHGSTNWENIPYPAHQHFLSHTVTTNLLGSGPVDYPVIQGSSNVQISSSPVNTNLPSTSSQHLSIQQAQNSHIILQNQMTNFPPGSTSCQKLPSPANTNFPSTSNQNLSSQQAQNSHIILQNQMTNFSPGSTSCQKLPSPANTNLPSTSNQNLSSQQAQNSHIILQNQMTNFPPGSTSCQRLPSPANTNLPSTSNQNLSSQQAQNSHIILQNQMTNFPPGSTSCQRLPSPANTNLPSTSSQNLSSQQAQNSHIILQNQMTNFPPGSTSCQRLPSPANTNLPSTSSQNLSSQQAQNSHIILQNQMTNFPPGSTSYQKLLSSANTNCPLSCSQNLLIQEAQNAHNMLQKQMTNFSSESTSRQKASSPANTNLPSNNQSDSVEYTLDSVFSKVHEYLLTLQTCLRLSCLSMTVDQQAQLERTFLINKTLLFKEMCKYCVLLNTNNVNFVVEDFVERYEQLVEVDQRKFDLKEVLLICSLASLPVTNADTQGPVPHSSSATGATNSAPRRQYLKKNSRRRVAENKQRRGSSLASGISQPGTSKSQIPPTIASGVPQSETGNSRTPPTFASGVPCPGPTIPQSGTANSRTPPTFASGVPCPGPTIPQTGTGNSRTPPTFASGVPCPGPPIPQTGTANSRTPPTFASGVPCPGPTIPQSGTANSRTPPTFASGVPCPGPPIPQSGTANSRTPPTFASGVPCPGPPIPQSGTGNSRTPPTFASGVPCPGPTIPQSGTANSRTPPTYISAVLQPGTTIAQSGTGNSRTPPTYNSAVLQPASTIAQSGTGNSRTPPTFPSGVPQSGTGNSRTPPTFPSGVPQSGTGNSRTPPTFPSGVPQSGTGNSRTPPTFPSGVPQSGTGNSQTPPTFPSGVPQSRTRISRTPPTFSSGVPQSRTGNSRTPPTFPSGVPQSRTGNSRTPPTLAPGVPHPGPTNSRTPPTFAPGVPHPGPQTNSRTSPARIPPVSQNIPTSIRASAVPQSLHSQFPRSRPPPASLRSRRRPEPPETKAPRTFFYPPETLQLLNRQIERYNQLSLRVQDDLHRMHMQDPTYRQFYHQALRNYALMQEQSTRSQPNTEQNIPNRQREHRQRFSMPAAQEILSSQRNVTSDSTFVPSTTNDSPAQKNSSRGHVAAGNLENIRNAVENFFSHRRNVNHNPANTGNQSIIPVPVEDLQRSQNSIHNTKNQTENFVESTLRHYLTTDNNNAQLPVRRNNAATIPHNPHNDSLENRGNIAVSMENNNPELELRPPAPLQPSTSQEATNNRNAQLEMRLNTAENQGSSHGEAPCSRNIAVSMENNNPELELRPPAPLQPSTLQEATNNRNAQLEMRLNTAENQQSSPGESPCSRNQKEAASTTNKKAPSPGTSAEESATQEPKNSGVPSEDAKANQENRKDEGSAKRDVKIIAKSGETDNNTRWKLRTSLLEKWSLQKAQELKLNQETVEENSSAQPRNDSTKIDQNFAVNPIKDQLESGRNPEAQVREAIQPKSSSSTCLDSSSTANKTSEDIAAILPTKNPEFGQISAQEIDVEASSSNSKIVEKLTSNRCEVRVVDVLKEFDALPSKKKGKKSSSKVAQNVDQTKSSPRIKTIVPADLIEESDEIVNQESKEESLPLVTAFVPINLIEESDKIENQESKEESSLLLIPSIVPTDLIEETDKNVNQESEEEDSDFTLYQSDTESAVSAASKISVITINDDDDDDDDDFDLLWIDESKTAETANEEESENEEITAQQIAEMAKKEENEIGEVSLPKNSETAEKGSAIGEATSRENAEPAEREANDIIEITWPENAERAEEEIASKTKVTLPRSVEISVEIDEETVDNGSREILEAPEKIQDEPTEIFSILDVKSISKDVFNKIGESDEAESAISPNKREPEEPESLDIKDLLLPNCYRCGKSSSVVCEQCFSAFYCSAECHHTHWAEIHHNSCKAAPEEAEELMP